MARLEPQVSEPPLYTTIAKTFELFDGEKLAVPFSAFLPNRGSVTDQWIRLSPPPFVFSSPRFESRSHTTCAFYNLFDICRGIVKITKKRVCDRPQIKKCNKFLNFC